MSYLEKELQDTGNSTFKGPGAGEVHACVGSHSQEASVSGDWAGSKGQADSMGPCWLLCGLWLLAPEKGAMEGSEQRDLM